jgi:rare lipoprotein A
MAKIRKSHNLSLKASQGIYLLAAASSLALAAVVVTLPTQSVRADVRLPRPAATAPPVLSPKPAMLTPQESAALSRTHALHGVASWYGSALNGRLTASGERFDKFAMTACHPTLPFGTLVRVIDRRSKRSIVVRINDRGDLAKGRIIDLSFGAAQKLAMVSNGLAKVDLQVISLGRPQHNKS